MDTMDTKDQNLVNLKDWKSKKKDATFSDYLKVLNFNDLVNESNELANQMKVNNKGDDLFSKTKVILNEFSHRLEKESKNLAESVKDFKKQIENKLQ